MGVLPPRIKVELSNHEHFTEYKNLHSFHKMVSIFNNNKMSLVNYLLTRLPNRSKFIEQSLLVLMYVPFSPFVSVILLSFLAIQYDILRKAWVDLPCLIT